MRGIVNPSVSTFRG